MPFLSRRRLIAAAGVAAAGSLAGAFAPSDAWATSPPSPPGFFNVINVTDDYGPNHGAKGDGVADDTEAIQAAITAAQNAGYGGIVYLPPGVYLISSMLTISSPGIWLRGSGVGDFKTVGSVLKLKSTWNATTSPYVIKAYSGSDDDALDGVFLSDFAITGKDTVTLSTSTYQPGGAGHYIWGSGFVTAGTAITGIYFRCVHAGIYNVEIEKLAVGGVEFEGANSSAAANTHNIYVRDLRLLQLGCWGEYWHGGTSDSQRSGGLIYKIGGNSAGPTGGVYRGIWNRGSGNVFDGGLNLNSIIGNALFCDVEPNPNPPPTSLGSGRQTKVNGVRMRNSNGGFYSQCDGFNVVGCTFRDLSQDIDNTYDAINIAPAATSDGSAGGVISGCDFSATADTTRQRYLINIANANMSRVRIGAFSYGWDQNATAAWGTGAINNAGIATQIDQPRGVDSGSTTPVTVDARKADYYVATANGPTLIINLPAGLQKGFEITYEIFNNSGGSLVTTWNNHTLAGAWVNPANGKRRFITFRWNGTTFYEISRTTADS
jgi:hypothetical protein